MTNKQKRKMYQAIAEKHGATVEEVERDMAAALAVGMANADPDVQAEWAKIPHAGESPTIEEVITHLADKVKKQTDED